MMDFALDDELDLLRRTTGEFANDHLVARLREHEADRGVDDTAAVAFGAIGLDRLELPPSLGGSGMGALARALVMEELGAADPGAALALDRLGSAFYGLRELGGASALDTFARPLLEHRQRRACLVWVGRGGRSRLEERDQRVSGRVPWVPADRVDLLVLLDESGARVITQRIESEELRGGGLRAAGASELVLESAPVAARWEDPASAALALARARLYTAALVVGVLRRAAEFSRNYARERRAFGRPIAHHQALAFLIADMATTVDAARLLVWESAWRLDEGLPAGIAQPEDAIEAAAAAFVCAVEAADFVGPNGVQILGGHGFMQDFPAEKMMRESRALGLLLGGVDLARETAGEVTARTQGAIGLSLEVAP